MPKKHVFFSTSSLFFVSLQKTFKAIVMNVTENLKCQDKFGEELQTGDTVDVQQAGHHTIYKKKDGHLYFRPYGEEERVKDYFSNDLIKVSKAKI